MRMRRTVAALAGLFTAGLGLVAVPSTASAMAAVNLSRPLIRASGAAQPAARPDGISVLYSGNWSGYAALPKAGGDTFTNIVASYNVPSLDCSHTPNTFSYHWIGLDGWADATVEQDGIAADCNGTTPFYAAWYEMYPAPFTFNFRVSPGDAIESAVTYLGNQRYELSLKDITNGKGFDVTRKCPVETCENSSAEAITEAYYYNRRFSGTSNFGDEHYENVSVTNSAGYVGGLSRPSVWRTGESIALGRYNDVDTTPGALQTSGGFSRMSAFSVFWSRKD